MKSFSNLAFVIAVAAPLAATAQDANGPRGATGTVTLSRTDYDRLIDLAGRRRPAAEQAPLPAALTRADLRVRVDGSTARATMLLDGEIFRNGTVKVPLITGATLLEARMAERPLPLVTEGGTHVAVLPGPASFSATLETGAPLLVGAGRGSFTLPVPSAGSVTATIDVPGDQTDVRISPGLILRRASANGRTTIEATLDPGAPLQVSFTTRESAPATVTPRDVRMLADLKTLVNIGEADIRLVTLVDLNLIQGDPSEVSVQIPAGYEVTGVSGSTLDRSEERSGQIVLALATPLQRRHQFLISLEKATSGGSFRLDTFFPKVAGVQRETGEVAVEGLGTLEIDSSEMPGLKRMDVREVDRAIASAAGQPLLAAFRYQRSIDTPPQLVLDIRRFADAPVLAAVADRAIATTLVTSEGRALTEVTLWVRNRAQPFLKVALPAGASMMSVEVAGEPAKPAEGKDGTRIPLLRPGFRPTGPYAVSFVYLHAGTPFAKKGTREMTLPRMDLPASVVEWELFVPDRYRADRFDGNVIAATLLEDTSAGEPAENYRALTGPPLPPAVPGRIIGQIVDTTGSALPGVTVTVQASGKVLNAITDQHGNFIVSDVPSGPVRVTTQLAGFARVERSLIFDQRPRQVDFTMQMGNVTETVTVSAESPLVDTQSSERSQTFNANAVETGRRPQNQAQATVPSANVQSLQRRAAGVLPVRIDVPRAGTSHRFMKPLVIDEEVSVSFRYRQR